MKYALLLLTFGLTVISAQGQYNTAVNNRKTSATNTKHAPGVSHSGARTTATTFATENFGSGGPGTLPTGWTAGTITGGTWKWTNHASTSTFSMGAMMSTTASNGWMIFDSDSIGAACSCAPAGWLQSPAYNCSAHPWVRLNFEDYYRKFEDSCYVWVSTSPTFSTYTSYPVLLNNSLTTNIFTANPDNAQIDISSAAGGQSSVYIRFVTWGPSLGAYSWMIDDLSLSDLDSIDVAVSSPSIIYTAGSTAGSYSYGTMPLKMAVPVSPLTFVSNNGFTNEPAASVSGKIYQGASSVYSATLAVNVPRDAYDTVAYFGNATPASYTPTAKGAYMVPFGVNIAGDAVTANNTDTTYFNITDSTWSENVPGSSAITSQYVYRPGTTANRLSFSPATEFAVPAGQTDTLTSVSVAFDRDTKAGQVVGVQIFHFDGTSWIYDGVTQFRALASGEISTSAAAVYANFMVDEVTTGGKIILAGGTGGTPYAAVVKGSSNTDTVSVLEGSNPAPNAVIGYTGLEDTSNNDGAASQQFGQGHLPFGNATTPYINLNFGIVAVSHVGIKNIATGNYIGKPYPNPANTSVSLPFTLSEDAAVTAVLSNIVGQQIITQAISVTAGVPSKVAFNTAGLSNGVYLYSLQFNGQQVNGRIVVAH